MPDRCDHCGRRLDRPTWDEGCPCQHAPVRLSDVIVRGVERTMERRGRLDSFDLDGLDEVRDELREMVEEVLGAYLGPPAT